MRQVVRDEHAVACHCVAMIREFGNIRGQKIGAHSGEALRGFARDESGAEVIGSAGENKPRASTPTQHHLLALLRGKSTLCLQSIRVFEQSSDVVKIDAGLGKVRHFSN